MWTKTVILIKKTLDMQTKKTRWLIFWYNQFMSKHSFHIQNPSIYLFQLDIRHLLINGYEICLNTGHPTLAHKWVWDMSQYHKLSDYNMQVFRYWLRTYMLDCFGQVLSPLCVTSGWLGVNIIPFNYKGRLEQSSMCEWTYSGIF